MLSAALRRAALIGDQALLVAHAEGEGRIVIETTDAIRARVWGAAAPADAAPTADAIADVRQMRREDIALSDRQADERSLPAGAPTGSTEAGAALLARLGL